MLSFLFLPDMRRKVFACFTFCIFLSIMACEKKISDQLKGKWQLRTIETSGHITPVDTVWYNFQSESLFMYQIYHPAADTFSWTYGFKTQLESHTIRLEIINWTILKDDFLLFTDWEEPVRTFSVDQLNRNRLVLTSDDKTYTFDKF